MARAIRITAGSVSGEARLKDSKTAGAVWGALPIEAEGATGGDESYCDSGRTAGRECPGEVVELGDLAYWPPGHAFCIFFGPTPASRSNECRAASAVNVVGKLEGDPTIFKKVRAGARVTIERQ